MDWSAAAAALRSIMKDFLAFSMSGHFVGMEQAAGDGGTTVL